MLDVSIVKETSPEANWNRQTGRQAADRQAYLRVGRLCLQKSSINESTTTKQYQNDQIATSSLWTSCLQQTDGDKQM